MTRPLAAATALLALAGCAAGAPVLAPSEATAVVRSSGGTALNLKGGGLPKPRAIFRVPAKPARPVHAATQGNSQKLHVGPDDNFSALQAFLGGAQRSIHVEVFNFFDDACGRPVAEILKAKARAGLDVRVMVDYMGSTYSASYPKFAAEMRDAGVVLEEYEPLFGLKGTGSTYNIDHRKSYLVDGVAAMVGGFNLSAPFASTTQDILVEWRGPVVADLYEEYALSWKQAAGAADTLALPPVSAAPAGTVDAQVVVTSTPEGRFESRDAIFAAVAGAKQEIVIEQQYLWDDKLVAALSEAAKRGVRVRAIVPPNTDKKLFKPLQDRNSYLLEQAGAEVRIYRGKTDTAHLHAKFFAVDGAWTTFGSTNGDNRGFNDNQELNVVVRDPAFVSELSTRLFEADWASHSRPFEYVPLPWYQLTFQKLTDFIDYYL